MVKNATTDKDRTVNAMFLKYPSFVNIEISLSELWETSQRDNGLGAHIFALHLAIFKYWWAWAHNGVSVRGKRRVLMFLFLCKTTRLVLWGSREKLFVCVYFIYTTPTRWGDNVILVSLHFTSDTNRSRAWMTPTWARKHCRTTPDNTDILIQLIFSLHWYIDVHFFKWKILGFTRVSSFRLCTT